ncbi:hypothetical protein C4A76_01570 [Brevibacillus laterosporus]|nr:hypothetical protein C4A76_01570 [Brevibacillus laterosporus]
MFAKKGVYYFFLACYMLAFSLILISCDDKKIQWLLIVINSTICMRTLKIILNQKAMLKLQEIGKFSLWFQL